jgi:hypothetical protein
LIERHQSIAFRQVRVLGCFDVGSGTAFFGETNEEFGEGLEGGRDRAEDRVVTKGATGRESISRKSVRGEKEERKEVRAYSRGSLLEERRRDDSASVRAMRLQRMSRNSHRQHL